MSLHEMSRGRPSRQPSDDSLFWYGNEGADEVGNYLFDVLALAMNELQPGEKEQDASFDRLRKVLYRHMDELAYERNSRARKIVTDSRLLKTEIKLYLAVSGC